LLWREENDARTPWTPISNSKVWKKGSQQSVVMTLNGNAEGTGAFVVFSFLKYARKKKQKSNKNLDTKCLFIVHTISYSPHNFILRLFFFRLVSLLNKKVPSIPREKKRIASI
jgi:hypothetical protein